MKTNIWTIVTKKMRVFKIASIFYKQYISDGNLYHYKYF